MRFRCAIAFVLLLCVAPVARASAPPRVLGTVSLPEVVAPLLPAVVSIAVLHEPAATPPETAQTTKPTTDLGSGFIIDPNGVIVTNRHVVDGGYRLTVTLEDGTQYPAHLLGTNALPDLAVLKINANHPLPAVHFGDSNALRIGDTVVVIGNPLGLSSSISAGVVSALNRNLDTTVIDDFIQTDAAINHGNSGGPMFNLKGQVVGVSWALISPGNTTGSIGIGLAIPSRDAAFVVQQILRYGRLHAGFSGMRLQQVTPEIAVAVGLDKTEGAIVASVTPGGPAAAARINAGDVVLEYNNSWFADVRALRRAIGETPPNTTVPVLLWRDQHSVSVNMTVTGWPASLAALDPAGAPVIIPGDQYRNEARSLGLTMRAVTSNQAAAEDLPAHQQGVLVQSIAPHSLASEAGLITDDIILRVGSTPVTTPQQVTDIVAAAGQKGAQILLLLVQRQGRPQWIPMRMHPR